MNNHYPTTNTSQSSSLSFSDAVLSIRLCSLYLISAQTIIMLAVAFMVLIGQGPILEAKIYFFDFLV